MSYIVLSHVATADLATAALHNILLDDLAIQKIGINDDGTMKYPPPRGTAFSGVRLRSHMDSDSVNNKVQMLSADWLTFDDVNGSSVYNQTALTADVTSSGAANGLDTGSVASDAWYQVYAIRKSSDGTMGLLLHRALRDTLDQSFTTAQDATLALRDNSARTKIAQKFQCGLTGPPTVVFLDLVKSGSPTGNVWLTIEADSAGAPSGTPLMTSNKFDVSKLNTTSGYWFGFVFRTSSSLTSGTSYWLVLQGDFTIGGNYVVAGAVSGGGYGSGVPSSYNGGSWSSGTNDLRFKTYAQQGTATVTMPTGYDMKCLIGWALTDGSNHFKRFMQVDRTFQWIDQPSALSPGDDTVSIFSAQRVQSSFPPLVAVSAIVQAFSQAAVNAYLTSFPDQPALAAAGLLSVNGTGVVAAGELPVEFQTVVGRRDGNASFTITGFRW